MSPYVDPRVDLDALTKRLDRPAQVVIHPTWNGCPAVEAWASFWSKLTLPLADLDLAKARRTLAPWDDPASEQGTDGDCPHCTAQVERLRRLVAEGVAFMTPADADAAVARGAAVLDERGPAGWRETVRAAIEDDKLRMDEPRLIDGCGCVCAHAAGSYWTVLAEHTDLDADRPFSGPQEVFDEALDWAVDHGFAVPKLAVHSEFDDLAAAWARLLGAEVPA